MEETEGFDADVWTGTITFPKNQPTGGSHFSSGSIPVRDLPPEGIYVPLSLYLHHSLLGIIKVEDYNLLSTKEMGYLQKPRDVLLWDNILSSHRWYRRMRGGVWFHIWNEDKPDIPSSWVGDIALLPRKGKVIMTEVY